ncbi:MAG: hypothetical protein R2713_09425 [Ilumatobacteraceae bacterium]
MDVDARGPLPPAPAEPLADYAVVGGSGFYELLGDAEDLEIDTPFGPPAGPVSIGRLHGRRAASPGPPRPRPPLRRPPGAVSRQRVGVGVARRAGRARPVFHRIVAARAAPG